MITSKQRAQLRAMANGIETILQVGKGGITETVIRQADDALTAREIIKIRALENSPAFAREAAEEIAEATRSEIVQVIGTRFVLFRKNNKNPQIVLEK